VKKYPHTNDVIFDWYDPEQVILRKLREFHISILTMGAAHVIQHGVPGLPEAIAAANLIIDDLAETCATYYASDELYDTWRANRHHLMSKIDLP
jgi:hypothetical protein